MEITSGVAQLDVKVRRDALARYGLNVSDVEQAVAAGASGDVISEVVDGQKRYTVALRLPDRYRTDADAMRAILLKAPGGEQVALEQVADIGVTRGPEKIEREEGQRRVVVMSNVRGRDLGSFVDDVRSRIERMSCRRRATTSNTAASSRTSSGRCGGWMFIVPIVISVIFVLLYLTFNSVSQALLVVGNIPFALVGGIAALWLRGMNLNPVGIRRLHCTLRRGDVEWSGPRQLHQRASRAWPVHARCRAGGATRRLRPVLMTALVASVGFIPMAIATSTGAEVQRPLASVVIGGLREPTALTLILAARVVGMVLLTRSKA
jgi:cobalt-zinc-cadmium resistance protein CzcA